jgi:DNA-directed RNA polymerase I, II, and III subunit RPABC2
MSDSEEEVEYEEEEEEDPETETVVDQAPGEFQGLDYAESEASDEERINRFEESMKEDLVAKMHPQEVPVRYEDVKELLPVHRDEFDRVDPLHTTTPILTKFEKSSILGLRAKQINSGAPPFVERNGLIDGYQIALEELKQKKLPFIIKRPLPDGRSEYWNVSDLEVI